MKQIRIPLILTLAALISTSTASAEWADIDTNNIADWDVSTNATAAGEWSYYRLYKGTGTIFAPESGNTMQQHFTFDPAKENWTVDGNNSNKAWYVDENGGTYTDSWPLAWVYTAAEDGDVRIHGTYTGSTGYNFGIVKTTDTDASTVVWADVTAPLFQQASGDNVGSGITFDFTVSVEAGNDIAFISDTTQYWWVGRTLEASIVPEPSSFALLAGLTGLSLVALRRRS